MLGQPQPGVGFFDPLLVPKPASYLNVFINDAEGNPIPGATVAAIIPEPYNVQQVAEGGEEGVAFFGFSVPPGPVAVAVVAPGYTPVTVMAESGSRPNNISGPGAVTVVLEKRGWVGPLVVAGLLGAVVLWGVLA